MTEVYLLPVPLPQDLPRVMAALPRWRRERAAALRRPQTQARSAAAGLLLERCLGFYGLDSAQVSFGPQGKPELPGHPLHFNLSHSGQWAVCALSADPVGVDVEVLGPPRPHLTGRVCAPGELGQLRTPQDFYRLWTAKESFLKYLGVGLSAPLAAVEVDLTGGTVSYQGRRQAVCLAECPLEGYALTLCGPSPGFRGPVFLSYP